MIYLGRWGWVWWCWWWREYGGCGVCVVAEGYGVCGGGDKWWWKEGLRGSCGGVGGRGAVVCVVDVVVQIVEGPRFMCLMWCWW